MAGTIGHIMSMANESMGNARVGVDVTGHNIANAHTPGFSRQKVDLQTRWPQSRDGIRIFGNGARIAEIERAHDKFIETQILKESQTTSLHESVSHGLKKIETIFNPELTATVRDRFTEFNNALRNLSNYPEEQASRTHVVESGMNLANTIAAAHNEVRIIQKDLTQEIDFNLTNLNEKLKEIANLNGKIREMESGSGKANDLLDKRDAKVREVFQLIDGSAYIDSNEQLVIRGPGGTLMVEGSNAAEFRMETKEGEPHPRVMMYDLFKQSVKDVSPELKMGRIAGLVNVRDEHAQRVRETLNQLAETYGNEFNKIHREGFGLGEYNSSNGRDFFIGIDPSQGEAAENMSVSELLRSDVSAVSIALTERSSGDNVLGNQLIKVATNPLDRDGKSVLGIYDDMVGRIGLDTMKASQDSEASKIVHAQLMSQREQVSGVSLDEEAANLLKYQHLFTASSRLINTADEMFKTILDLKR